MAGSRAMQEQLPRSGSGQDDNTLPSYKVLIIARQKFTHQNINL